PFVDGVEIALGQNLRQQMIALQLGKADVVEIAPEQARRAALDGSRVEKSAPNELIALVFNRDPQSSEEARLRQILSASIDRGSIANVLLQGEGQAAASIVPDWMTGYAFLFASAAAVKKSPAPASGSTLTLLYE